MNVNGVRGDPLGGDTNNVIGYIDVNNDDTTNHNHYENWININNAKTLTINNMNIRLTDVFNKPLKNLLNNTNVIVKVRQDPLSMSFANNIKLMEMNRYLSQLSRDTSIDINNNVENKVVENTA